MDNQNQNSVLEPAFTFKNEDTLLWEGTAIKDGKEICGKLEMNIHAYPPIAFTTGSSLGSFTFGDPMHIAIGKTELDFMVVGMSGSFDREILFKLSPSVKPFVIGDTDSIEKVVFHLFNFKLIKGNSNVVVRNNHGTSLYLTSQLSYNQWQITIQETSSDGRNNKPYRYAPTFSNVCRLKRIDGKLFSAEEASEILSLMRLFLSFVNGVWCPPVMAVGFDGAGEKVWHCVNTPANNYPFPNWYKSSVCLEEAFPLFAEKWSDEFWQPILRDVLYFYLSADNGKVLYRNISIVTLQAALEKLSYEYVVNMKQMLSDEGFDKLRASDKMRLLLSALNIPFGLDSTTPRLLKLNESLKSNNKFKDVPHAISDVRNTVTHSKRKGMPTIDNDTWQEVHCLSRRYLELCILAICGYNGDFFDVMQNKVVKVPWQDGSSS